MVDQLHFRLYSAQVILFQLSFFCRVMSNISQLYLSLFCLVLELLCLDHQHSIILALFHPLNLMLKTSALRRNSAFIFLPELFEIIWPWLQCRLRLFSLTSYFSFLNLVSDILFKHSMIFFSLFLWINFRF